MNEKLQDVLSKPFLLIQIGDYGDDAYDGIPIPPRLVTIALERQQCGKMTYPTSFFCRNLIFTFRQMCKAFS